LLSKPVREGSFFEGREGKVLIAWGNIVKGIRNKKGKKGCSRGFTTRPNGGRVGVKKKGSPKLGQNLVRERRKKVPSPCSKRKKKQQNACGKGKSLQEGKKRQELCGGRWGNTGVGCFEGKKQGS